MYVFFAVNQLLCLDKNLENHRWKLFAWIVHPLLDPEILKLQEKSHLYCICTLFIMQHGWTEPILTENEVKVFILMTLRLEHMEEYQFDKMHQEFVPCPRPVHLASLYVNAMWALMTANNVTGKTVEMKHLLLTRKFEGVLFQSIYLQMEHLGEQIIEDCERSEVERIFRRVTSNGRRLKSVTKLKYM